jgi:hypothetical protein
MPYLTGVCGQVLSLNNCEAVTDEGVKAVCHGCSELTSLSLDGCTLVTQGTVRQVELDRQKRGLPKLELSVTGIAWG